MTVRAEADPDHPAGHALIWVTGAATAVHAPGFRVQRDAGWGDDKLGPGGWQGSDALLQADRAEARGSDLVLHVGWKVCQYLEAGVYEFSVPTAGLAQMGLSWPDIVPQHAGTSRAPDLPPAPTAAVAEPFVPTFIPAVPPPFIPAVPPPFIPAVPPPDAPAALRSGTVRTAALAASLAVLLLGGGAYYWMTREPDRTELAATPAREPTPTPVAVGLGGLSVPDVLTRAPNPAAIAAEGQQRLQSDRRDDGLLLLEAAADRADPAAAAALGRLYDPVLFQPGGPIPRPDPRQAARYYRDATRGGADVAVAREALRQNLQARVQGGDLGATLNLKDFWP